MNPVEKDCCAPAPNKPNKGILSGVLYGLLPHSFCVAFILFSIAGSVAAAAFLKQFLLIPYFFHFLILLSLGLATLSGALYLKKTGYLSFAGAKNKWKYLTSLYSMTIAINVLMFFVVFPTLANVSSAPPANQEEYSANLSVSVQIPCSGHAPLIIDEIKKDEGVSFVTFKLPNIFEIQYNPEKTSPQKITGLEVFKTYKAIIQ
ncbi:MAG: hypothetical protein WC470_01030 [Candidatus Paceibacterota bacterium]